MMSSDRSSSEAGDHDPMSRMRSPEVPVYNCVVIVSPRDQQGLVRARCATVAGLDATGRSEREALAQVVTAFKATIARHLSAGLPIPWIEPPEPPAAGEQQRFIAMHL